MGDGQYPGHVGVDRIRQAAHGRWREILSTLGMDEAYLSNRHGPCPFCGGKDRWRWDDRDGNGSGFCNQCDATGDGFHLAAKLTGMVGKQTFTTLLNRVAEIIGVPSTGPVAQGKKNGTRRKKQWFPITPVPGDAPPPLSRHFKFGAPSMRWTYRDADGLPLAHVFRFDHKGGKEIWPLTFCQNEDGRRGWKWKGLPIPRPLYNLDKLAAKPDAPVLVVEGEKSAEAAGAIFPGHVPTTNLNGGKSAAKADWSPLAGRRVVIWPDHDAAGENHSNGVAQLALQTGAVSVRVVAVPDSFPGGWDLADTLPDGNNQDTLQRLLNEAQPWEPPADPALDPLIPSADSVPEIRWLGGKLPAILEEAEAALIGDRHGDTVYQRGGQLVRVARIVRPEVRDGIKREAGSLTIIAVDAIWLQLRLTEVAIWWKFDGRSMDWKRINAPVEVARALIANAGNWRFAQLVATIETPTLRPDGTILDRPGFDPATGLLYDRGEITFPRIKEFPSPENAQAALARLEELLSGFPFREPAHRSVALAAILTALVRRSLRTAPMFIFTAPKMGSGKSLLADVVALIATGHPATVMTHAVNADEERKRLLAILMEGDAVACVDNIERPLGSEALCSVLTQTAYKDRILGESRNISVPTLTTWLATGNNVTVTGDLTTRVVVCHLDPQMERPEERRFQVNLYQFIPKRRPELVAASLTILRAFVAAGKPGRDVPQFGRFEEWSDLVRGSLIWLGLPDPVTTRRVIEASDPVRNQLRMVLTAWHGAMGGMEVTATEIVAKARQLAKPAHDWHEPHQERQAENPALLNALQDVTSAVGQDINTRRLGKWLAKYENRIEEGVRIERSDRPSREGAVKWRVSEVAGFT